MYLDAPLCPFAYFSSASTLIVIVQKRSYPLFKMRVRKLHSHNIFRHHMTTNAIDLIMLTTPAPNICVYEFPGHHGFITGVSMLYRCKLDSYTFPYQCPSHLLELCSCEYIHFSSCAHRLLSPNIFLYHMLSNSPEFADAHRRGYASKFP